MVNRNWVGRCSFILVGFVLHVTYYGVVDGQFFNMLYQQLPPDWFTR